MTRGFMYPNWKHLYFRKFLTSHYFSKYIMLIFLGIFNNTHIFHSVPIIGKISSTSSTSSTLIPEPCLKKCRRYFNQYRLQPSTLTSLRHKSVDGIWLTIKLEHLCVDGIMLFVDGIFTVSSTFATHGLVPM